MTVSLPMAIAGITVGAVAAVLILVCGRSLKRRPPRGLAVDGEPLTTPELVALDGIESATRRNPQPDRLYDT
jgi:hypothetical protein